MEIQNKLTTLLADEVFQDYIRDFGDFSAEKQKAFAEQYGLSEKELADARRFVSGIAFKRAGVDAGERDQALKRLMSRIANTSDSAERRLGTGGLVQWVSRIAAILSIPLLLTSIYFYQQASIGTSNLSSLAASQKTFNTFRAPLGAKTQVVLPDGSLVWLNSGSSLSFPSVFDGHTREVKLKGEAYFEVVKNEQVPMLVSAGQLTVKVYGTTFNVNAFADNGLVETTLVEGKVTLIPKESHKEYLLEPGYSASYDLQNQEIRAMEVSEMEAFTGWKDGKLLFHDERFAAIVDQLERWYNVDIKLADPSLGEYTLYATFVDENIEQVLSILSNSIPINVRYIKRHKQADGSYSKRKVVITRDVNRVIN
ncbi:FecR family protein [Sunxiuqinia sp. sy24]|uniref:FecR family protein n=1 Tax=Sunxiuqinia sp. sy24 TaxID=3461495 RepID=UPI004045D9B9